MRAGFITSERPKKWLRTEHNLGKCYEIQEELKKLEEIKNPVFPQHIAEGLLNSRRRVRDRSGWISFSQPPAKKRTDVIILIIFVFVPQK